MNTYTFQEVMQYVMENDVKFIRLAFCDIFGTQKNISIMPRELSRAFREGICPCCRGVRHKGALCAFSATSSIRTARRLSATPAKCCVRRSLT